MIFTVMCALPAAAGVVPTAIAQEEDASLDDDQNLASDIVSEVLGGGDADDETDQDATNTATINPNQEQDADQTDFNEFGDETADTDQDQRDANIAVPIAIPINVHLIEEEEEEEEQPPEEEPPEDGEGVSFCFTTGVAVSCFPTLLECEVAREAADPPAISPCVEVGPG